MANPLSPLTPLIHRYRQENKQDVPDYPDARSAPLRASQPSGSEAHRDPVPAEQADQRPEDVHRVYGEGSGADYRGERVGPEYRPGCEAVDQMTGGLGKHASEYIEMKWDSYMIHQYAAWSSYRGGSFVRISPGMVPDTVNIEII